ncbi:RNA polymerase sigma factor [Leucobacter chromiiresistens]|uniref:RNA polymerase sigma factor n=1 Tax=Leucobacter chromiiresistens TaxID=1079994 RepID=UPI0009EA03FC|nr:sigma-70 family RNA polymerase sigma factor [Leucobacter chromiiresistens]
MVTGGDRAPGVEAADDRIVAGRAADGDATAFAVLVRRYTPMMRAYARRLLNGTADVDDVVQEAFVTAWEQLPGLEDPGKVKSWLMRITSRKAIDRTRAARPYSALDAVELPAAERSAPPRQAEARAGIAALRAALQELPQLQRECWVMREIGGSSYDEIADELQISRSTVRGLLARARKDIIVRMEQWR